MYDGVELRDVHACDFFMDTQADGRSVWVEGEAATTMDEVELRGRHQQSGARPAQSVSRLRPKRAVRAMQRQKSFSQSAGRKHSSEHFPQCREHRRVD